MKCPLCGNEMHLQDTMVKRTVNGKPVVLKSVPALVCTNEVCGQKAIYPDIAHKIEDVLKKARIENIILDPVFDFREVDKFLSNELVYRVQ